MEAEHGERGSQFVRGIGDEALLGLISLRQPIKGAVDSAHQRANLFGKALRRDAGARVPWSNDRGFARGRGKVSKAPTAHEPNQQDRARAVHQQYQDVLIRVLEEEDVSSGDRLSLAIERVQRKSSTKSKRKHEQHSGDEPPAKAAERSAQSPTPGCKR
ncbi:hypothetical protein GCM10011395_31490 [Sphingomonas psychrolutea]|uniref:Uncharacterized protein n=1 Tax=Sphingomonas psychrolutea TaxID=1259676 RepID=A0ABQ1H4W7_9SPHN|nr:hypothetical protein GCM10011395_31490 [Sphingomonas psychrolutea]